MLLINNSSNNPYYNLALEEHLFTNYNEDIVMLWQNTDSVILGKNQNAYEEINLKYVKEKNINVVRRITGGGTVFHDLGNVNFTFISKYSSIKDFKYFSDPIIEILKSLGINAYQNGRNDIFIDGKKFSGNAQTIRKNRILHHGTLLFNSDLSKISKIINKNNNYNSSSVKSNISKITNISDHLKEEMSSSEFIALCNNFFLSFYNNIKEFTPTEKDIKEVKNLINEKYGKDLWNFGAFNHYTFEKQKKYPFGTVKICMDIVDGYIKEFEIFGDFFFNNDIEVFKSFFINKHHLYEEIKKILETVNVSSYITGMSQKDFTELLF